MFARFMRLFVLFALLLPVMSSISYAQDDAPVETTQVHAYAVLFHSHGCPHCVEYIANELPELEAQFGDQLTVVQVAIDDVAGRELAMAAYQHYNIPQNDWVVPMMVVNDEILIGGAEIPARAAGIVRDGLAVGGINLPEVAGMADYYQARYGNIVRASGTTTSTAEMTSATLSARIQADPANIIAIVVLVALIISFPLAVLKPLEQYRTWIVMGVMVGVVLIGASLLLEGSDDSLASASAFVVLSASVIVLIVGSMVRNRLQLLPFVIMGGLVVAGYLAYVEVAHAEAACGLVGNCNAVQQSPYAYVLGVPVGVIGTLGYLAIAGVYFLRERIPNAMTLVRAMTAFGLIFSAYLTFLEPFVIGATCMWCIMSALFMMATWWLVAPVYQSEEVALEGELPIAQS
jgi:uncharacterized membrane protein